MCKNNFLISKAFWIGSLQIGAGICFGIIAGFSSLYVISVFFVPIMFD